MDMCVFPIQVLVLKKIPLNYAYCSVGYNQILQSYFCEKGGVFHILINNNRKMICYCYDKSLLVR